MNWKSFVAVWIFPLLIAKSKIKLDGYTPSTAKSIFSSFAVIFNLSAPGAAKFKNPLELSFKLSSSFDVTTSSNALNPTAADGLISLACNITSCSGTSTRNPFIKNTPFWIPYADPVTAAFDCSVKAKPDPAGIEDIPSSVNGISEFAISVSPSKKVLVVLSEEEFLYAT